MEDAEGVLSFDFEGGLETGPPNLSASVPVLNASDHSAAVAPSPAAPPSLPGSDSSAGGPNVLGRRSFRQTVCRHWLRSLCMKGDACGFLHQYDKSRMPICRFFRLYGECREQDCVYKHTNEDIKECNMYKLGFCPNGPDCRYRHAKLPGPPPPVEEVLQKIQQLTSYYGSSNRFFQQRSNGVPQQTERSQLLQVPNSVNQAVKSSVTESANLLPQQQQQVQQGQQLLSQVQSQNHTLSLPNQPPARGPSPLPQGISRYFIVKSCNRENLELSVQQGVWATQRSNEPKLNEAFDSTENVILIFSVNRTRHFQGCAKMTSKIGGTVSGGNWKYAHGTAHYGRNFSVKWLKLCELSFQKTRHLRNPYNENLPVKISRDCQELESCIGEQLASLLYLEPDSELMAVSLAAEAKREEEKAKGLNPDGVENPDIVPFDDEEEEEEEEESEEEEEDEEEEEESYGHPGGPRQTRGGGGGRGRGGGMLWPPMPPMVGRGGARPGMRAGGGFPPMNMNMMMMGGGDGFSYGPPPPPEGFGMPELFGMGGGPRPPFPPPHYGGPPRFSGDFPGHGPMFPGRPPAPQPFPPGGGFGGRMMMGGRGGLPFMGGSRAAQHVGGGGTLPPPLPPPPPQNSSRLIKKASASTSNDNRYNNNEQGSSSSRGGQEALLDEEQQYNSTAAAGNSINNRNNNDDSASEDEAPRRSRHGEGRKKRRGGHEESSDDAPPPI